MEKAPNETPDPNSPEAVARELARNMPPDQLRKVFDGLGVVADAAEKQAPKNRAEEKPGEAK